MKKITCWSITYTILWGWVIHLYINTFNKENNKKRIWHASLDQSGTLKVSQATSMVKNIPALSHFCQLPATLCVVSCPVWASCCWTRWIINDMGVSKECHILQKSPSVNLRQQYFKQWVTFCPFECYTYFYGSL